jgi:hypothetical protein
MIEWIALVIALIALGLNFLVVSKISKVVQLAGYFKEGLELKRVETKKEDVKA